MSDYDELSIMALPAYKPLDDVVRASLVSAWEDITWIRRSSGEDLFRLASHQLSLDRDLSYPTSFAELSAIELGNMSHQALVGALTGLFERGTGIASELADQIQICRAFGDSVTMTNRVTLLVSEVIDKFPRTADDLKRGHNPGDVLDPFILSANFELLSSRVLRQTIATSMSHKALMKIEDLLGNLHQTVIGLMRGNFRIPEPRGTGGSKERLDPVLNPFPGADVGQVPVPDKPDALRLFQVKSKTGSAKGGDGKRLGEQLRLLEETYGAQTFFAAVVGNTLQGHRSMGAVLRESPNTAVVVGNTALNELTQSAVGGELLLRVYQRAFRRAAEEKGYDWDEIVATTVSTFEKEAADAGDDWLTVWLHKAISGKRGEQDSRVAERQPRSLRRRG